MDINKCGKCGHSDSMHFIHRILPGEAATDSKHCNMCDCTAYETSEMTCQCEDPSCAKCLLVNCKDDNCSMHPIAKKQAFRESYKNR